MTTDTPKRPEAVDLTGYRVSAGTMKAEVEYWNYDTDDLCVFDVPALIADLAATRRERDKLLAELAGLRATLSEAFNSGDGSYRP